MSIEKIIRNIPSVKKHGLYGIKLSLSEMILISEEYNAAESSVEQANQAVLAASETIQKLVAENAALKEFIVEECVIPHEFYGDNKDAADFMPETTATDAAIAEIGAKPLDNLAGVAETMLVKFSNAGVSHCPEAVGWRLVKRQAESEAANLRAGRKG